jgi:hypothetical protein
MNYFRHALMLVKFVAPSTQLVEFVAPSTQLPM